MLSLEGNLALDAENLVDTVARVGGVRGRFRTGWDGVVVVGPRPFFQPLSKDGAGNLLHNAVTVVDGVASGRSGGSGRMEILHEVKN